MALKGVEVEMQKKILSMMPKKEAIRAFEVLSTKYKNEETDIKRAQNKVVQILKRFGNI